jgi:hypothetical protein
MIKVYILLLQNSRTNQVKKLLTLLKRKGNIDTVIWNTTQIKGQGQ